MGMDFKIDRDARRIEFTLKQELSFDDILQEYAKQKGSDPQSIIERFAREYVDFTDFGTAQDYLEEVMENVIYEEDV